MPIKILMVCLGNICRSPVAEGIMRSKIDKYKLDVVLDSAGTSTYHICQNPDKRSIANAIKHKIDISKLVAREFTKIDFENFDLIFAMDSSNYNDILRLANNENQKNKVHLLLNALSFKENKAVPDPYYGNETDFEIVFNLIDEACEKIAQKLSLKS